MMTVRFPDGTSIQYNTAGHVTWGNHVHVLRTEKEGQLIAIVPSTSAVELVPACRIFNPTRDFTNDRISSLEKAVRSLTRKLSKGK